MTESDKPFTNQSLYERLDLNFTLKAAGLGVWELDPATKLVNWDDRCRQLFGLAKDNLLPYEQAIGYIHPDDREKVNQAVAWAMNPESDGEYDLTYRTIGADDGLLRWVRFRGQGYFNEAGEVIRFAGIAQEVTQQITAQQGEAAARQEAQRQERIYNAITASIPDLVYVFDLSYRFTYANQALLSMWGSTWEESIGKGLLENGYEPWHAQMHEREIDQVVATRQPIRGEVAFPHATLGKRIYDYVFAPVFNELGEVEAVAGTTRDITDIKQTQKLIEESQRQLLALFEQSPVGLASLSADDDLVFEWANAFYGELVARSPQTLVGKPLLEALPEIKGQGFDGLLKEVIATGIPFRAQEVGVNIRRANQLTTIYVDFTYQPRKGSQQEVLGVLVVVTDVTQQVLARKKIEESELFVRSVIDHSPVAKVVFTGPDMMISVVNKNMLAMLGRDESIIGQPFMEAMPELKTTPLLERLRQVYTTGETYYQPEERIELIKFGQLHMGYYNYTYKALHNTTGNIYGIITTATDVTEQVIARQKIRESEASLQVAIELAELATWHIDTVSGSITYSERLQSWLGLKEAVLNAGASPRIHPKDRERIRLAMAKALEKGSSGHFDEEYTIINAMTGQDRIIHASGQTIFDTQGNALSISGTAQDVTLQRELQLALENQVQTRTEELAALNEELSATNEALSATNEELTESTALLVRSNENLQKFAYVASHDLQEPLRKIQQFGDLLKTRYPDSSGEQLNYLDRMQVAARRMSMLIKDLLDFSRIATRRDESKILSLNEVIQTVLTDLELVITETGAQIEVDPMPQFQGDASQLGQLFQNLLSNALKFSRIDSAGRPVMPRITVRYALVDVNDLPPGVKPIRVAAQYHHIAVIDNGIGFDERYLDRIFQVFQRLHGKNEFAGTGIGLAICERVVANHGGTITAGSQPGQGATFTIYLPM